LAKKVIEAKESKDQEKNFDKDFDKEKDCTIKQELKVIKS